MTTPDLEFYEKAGLYAPTAEDAEVVRNLLYWFEELGWEPEQVVAASAGCELAELAADAMLRKLPEYTMEQAANAVGMSLAEFDQLRRTAGLAPRPLDRPVLTKDEVEAFKGLQFSKELFTDAEASHFARVLGSSLARIADAGVSLFLIDIEGPLRAAGGSEFDIAKENISARGSLDGLAGSLDPLLRLHLEDAIKRSRDARAPGDDPHISRMAVGFVDLVGFTAYSEEVSARELGLLVRRFEDAAYDLVADHSGRVVKLIGDEVMFVAVNPEAACEAAMALMAEFQEDRVTPRAGLAYGDLLTRGGDYYGPIVNLASRIGDLAVPCEMLATPEIAELCPNHSFEPAGRRQLKGFEDPVSLVSMAC